jgi:probable rRNA maturation factor
MTGRLRSSVAVGGATGGFPRIAVRRAVETVLAGEHRTAMIGVTFLGPHRMRRLNHAYKGHDAPTDVISFALPQPDGTLSGDIYLCRSVAAREARRRRLPVREEILRLAVHGTLHVLGYDHPESEGRERSEMWQRQEHYVRALQR